jgi:hypothetical protein
MCYFNKLTKILIMYIYESQKKKKCTYYIFDNEFEKTSNV